MNNQLEKNHITEKILGKIKTEKIKMKPKIYFILRMALLVLGTLTLASFIVYLISFIVFSLRVSGVLFLPKFGFPGIRILISSLPWFLILISGGLIVLLEVFTQKFRFVYRKPILYSLLGIIIIVFTGSFLMEKTSFHSSLFWKAQEKRLPAIGSIYRDYGVPRINNVHQGVISEVIEGGFKIETLSGEVLSVVVDSKVYSTLETDTKEGDVIVILGEQNSSTIQALDLRKVQKDFNLFPRQRMKNFKLFDK